jgi:hypothetical protein
MGGTVAASRAVAQGPVDHQVGLFIDDIFRLTYFGFYELFFHN